MKLLYCTGTLQRHCTENLKQIFPEMKLRLQIHECRNWEGGRAVSFLGKHKLDLLFTVGSCCT
jgi:hypothetical protein